MNRRRAGLVAVGIAVLLLSAAGGVVLYGEYLYRDTYGSTYEYDARFAANESLSNLSVYVPVPESGGDVRLLGSNLSVRDESIDVPANASVPSARLVDTQYGTMLALDAETFAVEKRYYRYAETNGTGERVEIPPSEYDPDDPSTVAVGERAVSVTVEVQASERIDTAAPAGNEPLLAPRIGAKAAPCASPSFDTQACYRYDSRVFLAYDGPENVRTSVWVETNGRNEWWVYGWSGNEYRDAVIGEYDGPQRGWQTIAGTLEAGWGDYRSAPPANRSAASG